MGMTPKPRRAPLRDGGRSAAATVKGRGDVWFAEANDFRETVVLDRAKLLPGDVIEGPATMEEHDASTLIHPSSAATLDEHGNLVMRPRQSAVSRAIQSRSACSAAFPAL